MGYTFTTGASSGGSSTTGGYSFSTGGSSVAGGVPREVLEEMARKQAQDRADAGGGIMGLLGNAYEGVTGLVGGIGSLISAGVHDVGRATASAIPGRQDWGVLSDNPEGTSKLLPMAKGMAGFTPEGFHPLDEASVAGNIWNRWQPFLPGGDPASEGWEGLYEDPLGAVFDVAALASGGAALAGKAGAGTVAASRIGEAAKAGVLDDLVKAGSRMRTAEAASTRSGLEAMAKAGEIAEPFYTKLLPKATSTLREGEGLVASTQAYNPLYRAVAEPIKRYGLTKHIDDLTTERGVLEAAAKAEPGIATKAMADVRVLDDTIAAMKSKGLTRIERPLVAKAYTKYDAARQVLNLSERFYNKRDAISRAEVGVVERALTNMGATRATLDAAKERFAMLMQRLDVDIEDATVPDVIGLQDLTGREGNISLALGGADEAAGMADPAGGVATMTRPIAPPDHDLSIRTEAVRAKTQEFMDDLETNRAQRIESGWDVDTEIADAQELLQDLDDGLLRMLDPEVKAEYKAIDELRLLEAERISGATLEDVGNGFMSGTLTPSGMLSRNYRSLQGKYGLEWSDEAGDYINGPDRRAISAALRRDNQPAPVYFGHIDANHLKGTDWFRSRQKVGANIYARDPHNKQMKLALLRNGSWLKDPIEVIKRRGSRAVREAETYHTWKAITERYGLALDDASAVPRGYSLVAPDVLHANYRVRQAFLNKIDDNLTAGMNRDAAVARAFKDTLDAQREWIKTVDADSVKFYAVPDSVLRNLDATAKWSPAFGGKGVQLYYDTAMNAWRGMALTASPRWVMNNVLGNIAFSLMQGVKVGDVARIGAEKFRAMLAERSSIFGSPELRAGTLAAEIPKIPGYEQLGGGFFGSRLEQYKPHLPGGAEDLPGAQGLLRLRESRASMKMHNMGQAVKRFNSTIEDTFREASFLTAAEKSMGMGAVKRTVRSFSKAQERIADIMKNGFDGSTTGIARMELALREVNTFFGAYGKMTPFERHVIRRFIFPFWGFYRHSTSLMMRFPFEYPGRAELLQSLEAVTQDMLEEYGPLPEWMRSPMPIGPPGGVVEILSGAGANPFAGPGEGMAGLTQMFSPVIKTALEQATGRNAFTGQEFTDRDVFTPYGSDQAYDLNTGEPVDKVAPGLLQALASQVPQFDMLRDLLAGGNTYDTASLLDALQQRMGDTGEASPIDPETGEPYYGVNLGDQLAKMAGFNTFSYDLPAFQERQAEDQLAVLRELLKRQAAGAA